MNAPPWRALLERGGAPLVRGLGRLFSVARRTIRNYQQHNLPRMGAALAYYTFFSLFPLLLLLISVLGYLLQAGVPLAVDGQRKVLEAASLVFPQAEGLLKDALQATAHRSQEVGLVGMATLLWSASNVFAQLNAAFQVIWGVEEQVSFLHTRLVGFLMVLTTFLILLLSTMGMVAADVALEMLKHLPYSSLLWELVARGTSFLATALIFALLYRYLPQARVRWRHAGAGAVLAAIGWEGLKWGFSWYVSQVNYRTIYGPVGSVVALLFWVYLSSQVLLVGGELAAACRPQKPPAQG